MFLNLPTTSASHPYTYDEYPTAWIFAKNPTAEAEARGYMNVFISVKKRLGVGTEAPQRLALYDSV
eukprot:5278162-Pyramimonas_sp.AAC.1